MRARPFHALHSSTVELEMMSDAAACTAPPRSSVRHLNAGNGASGCIQLDYRISDNLVPTPKIKPVPRCSWVEPLPSSKGGP